MRKGLYVVVRSDLPIGLQMAQLGHAAFTFGREHPDADVGENIYVKSAASEPALLRLVQRAVGLCPITVFHEPDIGGQLTAAAFGAEARGLLSALPLAGKPQAACCSVAESCAGATPGGAPGMAGAPGGPAAG